MNNNRPPVIGSRDAARLFVSYAHDDVEDATWIADRLREAGHTVWMDRASARGGDVLVRQLDSALWTVNAQLVILTPRSIRSRWVQHEIAVGRQRQIEHGDLFVIPLVLEDCEIPTTLRDLIRIDFRIDRQVALGALLDQLRRRLDGHEEDINVAADVRAFLQALGREDELTDPTSRLARIEQLFVPPAELKAVWDILERRHCVFIVGDPHTGKTYLCSYMLLELFRAGYRPLWVTYDALAYRLRQGADLEQLTRAWLRPMTACYVEDPFGSVTRRELEQFDHGLKRLTQEARSRNARLLITSRDHIFDQAIGEEMKDHVVRLRCDLKVGASYSQSDLEMIARRYLDFYKDGIDPILMRDAALPTRLAALLAPHNVEQAVRSLRDAHDEEAVGRAIEDSRDMVRHLAAQLALLPIEDRVFLLVIAVFSEYAIPFADKIAVLERSLVRLGLMTSVAASITLSFERLAERNRRFVWRSTTRTRYWNRRVIHVFGGPSEHEFVSHQLRHPSYFEAIYRQIDKDPATRHLLAEVLAAALADRGLLGVTKPEDSDAEGDIASNFLLEAVLRIAAEQRIFTGEIERTLLSLVSEPTEHVRYAMARFLGPALRELPDPLYRAILAFADEPGEQGNEFSAVHAHLALAIIDCHDHLDEGRRTSSRAAFEKLLHVGCDGAAWAIVGTIRRNHGDTSRIENPWDLGNEIKAAGITLVAKSCRLLAEPEHILDTLYGSRHEGVRAIVADCFSQERNRHIPGAARLVGRLEREYYGFVRDAFRGGLSFAITENYY